MMVLMTSSRKIQSEPGSIPPLFQILLNAPALGSLWSILVSLSFLVGWLFTLRIHKGVFGIILNLMVYIGFYWPVMVLYIIYGKW